jgi:hypothetical protein
MVCLNSGYCKLKSSSAFESGISFNLALQGFFVSRCRQVDSGIFNLLGQKLATLVSEKQPTGNYKVEWDATGFASGFYFYRIETRNGFIQTKKLIFLK